MAEVNGKSPWLDWHGKSNITQTNGIRSLLMDNIIPSEAIAKKSASSPAMKSRSVFTDWTEYATIQAIATKQEHLFNIQDIVNFESGIHNMVLMQNPDSEEQWLGIVSRKDKAPVRVRTNDMLHVTFSDPELLRHKDKDEKDVMAEAIVLPGQRKLPCNAICLLLRTPKTRKEIKFELAGRKLTSQTSLTSAGLRMAPIFSNISNLKMTQVKIDLCQRNPEPEIALQALDTLHKQSDNGRVTMYKNLLVGRYELLPQRDIFCDIRAEFPHPEKCMRLNHSQTEAVRQGKNALGGILNIHGPPGTGKTAVIRKVSELYFQLKKQKQVMALSTTNLGADAIAKGMQDDLGRLQATGKAPENSYVVRLHSTNTDIAIFMKPAESARAAARKDGQKNLGQNAKGTSKSPEEEKMKDGSVKICDCYRNEFVPDERVQILELTGGYRMLQRIGAIKDDSKNGTPDPEWSKLADLYQRYTLAEREEDFGKDDHKQMQTLTERLYQSVIANAAAVVATVNRPALPSMALPCASSTHIIFIDEASRADEASMWPIFANSWQNLKGIVLLGDPHQLRNLVKSTAKFIAFGEQKRTTLPERLLDSGFPTSLLDTQMRMVPDISEPANQLVYHGALKNGSGTAVSDRPLAQQIRAYNKMKWNLESSLVYFNVPDRYRTNTKISPNGSRHNQFFMRLAFPMIGELLREFPEATIAFATPYTEDCRKAKACDRAVRSSNDFPNIDNLKITTWDTAQGLEFDIGVIVLPLVSGRRSIAHEKGRINMISTRWRCGLYIIGCSEVIDRSKPGGFCVDYLRRFHIKYWKENMVHVRDTDNYPTCNYYTPVDEQQSDDDDW